MKLELELKHDFLDAVERTAKSHNVPFKYTILESGGTQKAIPDTIAAFDRKSIWLEFKRMNNRSEAVVRYEPGQINELRLWNLNGMCAVTVGITQGQDFIIAFPNKVLLNTQLQKASFCLKHSDFYVEGSMGEQFDALQKIVQMFYHKEAL